MTDFVLVDPNELHDVWPLVKKGLDRIIRKIRPDWIAEDVYSALKAGTSGLHLGYEGDEYEGFVVLTPSTDFDGRILFVWAAYSPRSADTIEKYWPFIRDIATKSGSKKVRFASPREGFKKSSFTPVTTIYEKEV